MLSNNYIVCIFCILIIVILIVYLLYSKKEFFYQYKCEGDTLQDDPSGSMSLLEAEQTCRFDFTDGEECIKANANAIANNYYVSKKKCEQMWKCDLSEGACKAQPVAWADSDLKLKWLNDKLKTAKNDLDTAKDDLDTAKTALADAKTDLTEANEDDTADAQKNVDDATAVVATAQKKVDDAQKKVDAWNKDLHSKGWEDEADCEANCKFIKDDDKTCKIANDDERAGGSGLFSRKRYCEKRWECVDNGGKQGDRQCVIQAGGQYERERECESRCVALNENTYNPILEFTFVEDLSSLSEFDKNIFEKKLKELLSELLSEYSKYYHIYSKYIFLIEWDETNPNIINIKLLNHHEIKKLYNSIKDESEYIKLIKESIEILREQSIKLYISFNYYSISKITLKFEFEIKHPYCEWKEYGLPTEPILEYSGDYMFLEIENISSKLKTKVLIPNTVNKSATLTPKKKTGI